MKTNQILKPLFQTPHYKCSKASKKPPSFEVTIYLFATTGGKEFDWEFERSNEDPVYG